MLPTEMSYHGIEGDNEMKKIKTASGKELDCDYIVMLQSPVQAYIRVCNMSIAEVASIFSNKSETIQMWMDDIYLAQYTNLIAIIPENGAVKVMLGKE